MGLDDLVDEVTDSGSSSSSRRRKKSSSSDDLITFGQEPYKKKFTEEKLEEVKKVIRDEMGLNFNEVVNNRSSEERFEILHEAATYSDGDLDEDDMQNWSNNRCIVCGKAADGAAVEIAGETVHVHHTTAQLDKALDEET